MCTASPHGRGGLAPSGAHGTQHAAGTVTKTVWVIRKGRPQPITIRTGITDGKHTEVIWGPLREGDRVLIDAPRGQPQGHRRHGPGMHRMM